MSAVQRLSTLAALRRLLPYVRPALPRLIVGIVAGMVAGLVALVIPQVLEVLVDSALGQGDASAVLPARMASTASPARTGWCCRSSTAATRRSARRWRATHT